MFDQRPRETELLSWLFFTLWLLGIYLLIPFARAVQIFIAGAISPVFFAAVTGLFFLLLLAGLIRFLRHRQGRLAAGQVAVLILIGGVFLAIGYLLRGNPERTIHFVQYGGLSLLAYRALSQRLTDRSIYLLATLLCALCGTIDEMIQWATPRRYFDYFDILINFVSAALIQIGIAFGVRPRRPFLPLLPMFPLFPLCSQDRRVALPPLFRQLLRRPAIAIILTVQALLLVTTHIFDFADNVPL